MQDLDKETMLIAADGSHSEHYPATSYFALGLFLATVIGFTWMFARDLIVGFYS
jgi:hypothetical protein